MSEHLHPPMNEMMHRVVAQTEQKELWRDHDSPEDIGRMLGEEVAELQVAIQESMLSGDVFSVASEIGDVLYLSLKFCHSVGLAPEDVVNLKILRNDMKYPNALNSTGNYKEQRQKSKATWELMGGDEVFSLAYLDILAEIEDGDVVEEELTPTNAFAMALQSNGNGNGHHEENIFALPVVAGNGYSSNGNGNH